MSKPTDGIFGGYGVTAPTDITGGSWNVIGADGYAWGMKFSSSVACTINGVWLYASGYTGINNIYTAIFDTSGTQLNTATPTSISSGTGYFFLFFDPYTIAANTEYVVCAQVFAGGNSGYFAGGGPNPPYTSGVFTFKQPRYSSSGGLYADTAGFSTLYGIDISSNAVSITPILSDTVSLTDVIAKAITSVVLINSSDTLTAFSEANTLNFGAQTADTNSLSESIIGNWGFACSDSNTFSDSVLCGIGTGLTDTNSLSDALKLSLIYLPTDTLSISERVIAGWALSVSDTNAASWNDAVAFNLGTDFFVIVTDTETISDAISPFGRGFQSVTGEQISLADSYNGYAAGIPVSQSDTVSLSDFVVSGNPSLVDYLSLNDSVAFSSTVPSRLALDSLIVSDSVLIVVNNRLSSTDSIAISDLIIGTLPVIIQANTLSFSDTATYTNTSIFVDNPILVSDAMQFFDSRQVSGRGINPRLGDSFSLLDSVYPLLASVQNNYLRNYLNDVI